MSFYFHHVNANSVSLPYPLITCAIPCTCIFKQVQEKCVPAGAECEPLFLTVAYGNPDVISRGFPKNCKLAELRKIVTEITGADLSSVPLCRVAVKGNCSHDWICRYSVHVFYWLHCNYICLMCLSSWSELLG